MSVVDGSDAVYPDDVARQLVADGDGQHRAALGAALHRLADRASAGLEHSPPGAFPRRRLEPPVLVVNADEDPELELLSGLEEFDGRHGVRAKDVEAGVGDRCEIRADTFAFGEELPVAAGRERAVGDAAHSERPAVDAEVFSVSRDATRAPRGPAQSEHRKTPFFPPNTPSFRASLELGRALRRVAVPSAQVPARRDLAKPDVDGGAFPCHSAGPQAVDEDP